MLSHLGELAALGTAICFMFTAILYESAGKKVGSLAVSFIRLLIAFTLLGIFAYFTRGLILPIDADKHTWTWLLISGLVGLLLGDLFLLKAYVEIGSRISLLIMSTAPPLTAIIGFFAMGEKIPLQGILGMLINMAGISLVILSRNPTEKKIEFNRPIKGIVFASIGALGQALGLIFSKIGIGSYNPFAATQIRIIAAFIGFAIIITIRKKWPEIIEGAKNKKAMLKVTLGSVFGPFIGVTLSLVAVRYTATGIVSSISSISPILIIPVSIMVLKEEVLPKEILGAFVSIIGVILLFW